LHTCKKPLVANIELQML